MRALAAAVGAALLVVALVVLDAWRDTDSRALILPFFLTSWAGWSLLRYAVHGPREEPPFTVTVYDRRW